MNKKKLIPLLIGLSIALLTSNCQNLSTKNSVDILSQHGYCDAHTHLTTYGESAIDSLVKYNVTVVRDCGSDIVLINKWKSEIEQGKRKGPKIYFCGPMIDGRKEEKMRIAVYDTIEARKAVDSLVHAGVDFIKTHQALKPDCYFAILKEAKKMHIKVVSHLPQTVPVWMSADSGVSCIEHAAESFVASPAAAGFVNTKNDSVIFKCTDWWNSPHGDSIINHLGKLKLFFTPTLYSYKLWALQGKSKEEIDSRLYVLAFLENLTFKLHNAGVIILAGTDLYDTTWQHETPGKSLFDEIRTLEDAGLTKQEATDAATINFKNWLKK